MGTRPGGHLCRGPRAGQLDTLMQTGGQCGCGTVNRGNNKRSVKWKVQPWAWLTAGPGGAPTHTVSKQMVYRGTMQGIAFRGQGWSQVPSPCGGY